MTDPRPGWSDYFLGIADAVSARGDCTRRQVGAVLADPDTHDLIETGYNGPPAGQPGCLSAGACPRGRHYRVLENYGMYEETGYYCKCRNPWPCDEAVPPGSSYDTGPGACIAIHAEANALLRAGKNARGAHLYLTTEPCDGCMKLIRGAGVVRVIWPGGNLEL
jgi:dCMP deaminase